MSDVKAIREAWAFKTRAAQAHGKVYGTVKTAELVAVLKAFDECEIALSGSCNDLAFQTARAAEAEHALRRLVGVIGNEHHGHYERMPDEVKAACDAARALLAPPKDAP